MNKIKYKLKWLKLKQKLFENNFYETISFFKERNINSILIKGFTVSQFYDQPECREFVDVDLCVESKDFQSAQELLKTEYKKELTVDLHSGFRHLDTLPWEDLYENSRLIKIKDCEVRVLRPEDHLRVICTHWLTDGGAYRYRLWDIYFLVKNRPADFDWDRCLNVVSPQRRKRVVNCIGLAHKYLGLYIEDTPVAAEAKKLPAWLVRTVENEWADEVKLRPLVTCFGDKKLLLRQIKKRIPPNPIQATIDLEGDFDNSPRFFYQFLNFFSRLNTSIKKQFEKGI